MVARAGSRWVGADIFQTYDDCSEQLLAAGKLGTVVFDMEPGRLTFAENCFDALCANQAFEPIEALRGALAGIARAADSLLERNQIRRPALRRAASFGADHGCDPCMLLE